MFKRASGAQIQPADWRYTSRKIVKKQLDNGIGQSFVSVPWSSFRNATQAGESN